MKTAIDIKRREFMTWVANHPEIKDITKHLVADFLNQYNASCARIALVKENNELEIISEFGFAPDESVLGEIFESTKWQDTNNEIFKVIAGIAPSSWIKDNQVYVATLKVNSVNIGYAEICFAQPVDSQKDIESLLVDLSIGLSLYLGYQNALNKQYRRLEELAENLRIKESNSALKITLLTARQRNILQFMAEKFTNEKIALKLGFSSATIHHDSSEIYRILQVEGRKGAILAFNHHIAIIN